MVIHGLKMGLTAEMIRDLLPRIRNLRIGLWGSLRNFEALEGHDDIVAVMAAANFLAVVAVAEGLDSMLSQYLSEKLGCDFGD
jgi:hypothetical protein